MTILRTMRNFSSMNIAVNILLFVAVITAAIIVSSPVVPVHQESFLYELHLQIGNFNLLPYGGENLRMIEFINDGLMTIFSLLVGLEIKRELLVGELSSFRKAALSFTVVCDGMPFPAIVYMSICPPGSTGSQGLATPMATDIAFSLGVSGLLGSRVLLSLKTSLTAFVAVDDIGGILVIALFCSSHVSYGYILIAVLLYVLFCFIGKRGTTNKIFLLVIDAAIWYLSLQPGIHSIVSGAILALVIPAKPRLYAGKHIEHIRCAIAGSPVAESGGIVLTNEWIAKLKEVESASGCVISPLQPLEDNSHGAVNYLILPLPAFVNADIVSSGGGELVGSIEMAMAAGLLFDEFAGIYFFTWLAIKIKLTPMPPGTTQKDLPGIALLGGIGFAVPLFAANLLFGANYPVLLNQVKFGVLSGIILSGLLGYIVFRTALPVRGWKQ